jgi:hypothetical protein
MKNSPQNLNFWSLMDRILTKPSGRSGSILSTNYLGRGLPLSPVAPRLVTARATLPYVTLARNLYAFPDHHGRTPPRVSIAYLYGGKWCVLCYFAPTKRPSSGAVPASALTAYDDPTDRLRSVFSYLRGNHNEQLPESLTSALPRLEYNKGHSAFGLEFHSTDGLSFDQVYRCISYQVNSYVTLPGVLSMDESASAGMAHLAVPGTHWFRPARIASAQAKIMQEMLPPRTYLVYASIFRSATRKRNSWGARVHIVGGPGVSNSLDIYDDTKMQDITRGRQRLLAWTFNHASIPGPML